MEASAPVPEDWSAPPWDVCLDIEERERADPVGLVSYDPEWPRRFEAVAAAIRAALGDVATRIDHIGSTAVPGIAARPIVDVQVSVRSLRPFEAYARPLQQIGLYFRPDDEPRHRFFFDAGSFPRTVNVHVCEAGGEWERTRLEFRDYLRARPETAAAYEDVKQRLAARFGADGDAYARAKERFVSRVARDAKRWAREADRHPPG